MSAEVFNNYFNRIVKIKEKIKKYEFCSFYHVNLDKMLKILQNIHSKKDTKQDDIPVRNIKENKFTLSIFFLKCLTDTLTITLFLMD